MMNTKPYGYVLGQPVNDDSHDSFYKVAELSGPTSRVDFFEDRVETDCVVDARRWRWMWDVPGIGVLKRAQSFDTLEAAITDADEGLGTLIRLIRGER